MKRRGLLGLLLGAPVAAKVAKEMPVDTAPVKPMLPPEQNAEHWSGYSSASITVGGLQMDKLYTPYGEFHVVRGAYRRGE